MEKHNLKQWMKEHKKEILIGTVSAVGVGVLGYFGIKKIGKNDIQIIDLVPDLSSNIDVSLDTATVTEAWTEGEFTNLILNDFKPKDIGKLGKDLIKNVPGVTEDTVLTCVLGTTKPE